MSSVYVVSSEIGRWSYITVQCEGVFSTFEKAESWIGAQQVESHLYRVTFERDGWVKTSEVWSVDPLEDNLSSYEYEISAYKLLRTEMLVPTSTDGKTYLYDKSKVDEYDDLKTFYIGEMQIDPEPETQDGQ